MMRKWKQWWADRKFRRAYKEGYGWACTELLRHKKSLNEVEACVYGLSSPFDIGAQDAVREIDQLHHQAEEISDERATGRLVLGEDKQQRASRALGVLVS